MPDQGPIKFAQKSTFLEAGPKSVRSWFEVNAQLKYGVCRNRLKLEATRELPIQEGP
ncbi:MAG: hypothetical protein ACO1NU_04835 [Arcticibacter sp.]